MSASTKIRSRLAELVRAHNRGLAFDALLKVGLGIGFTLVTFGVLW